MTTVKRITDLSDYTSVLPYASEMFGVYQPMIGWRSQRKLRRYQRGFAEAHRSLLEVLTGNFRGRSVATFSQSDCAAQIGSIEIGQLAGTHLLGGSDSVLIRSLLAVLPKDQAPSGERWGTFINREILQKFLETDVRASYQTAYAEQCRQLHAQAAGVYTRQEYNGVQGRLDLAGAEGALVKQVEQRIDQESALAGALLHLFESGLYQQLETLFYQQPSSDLKLANENIAALLQSNDPFATFDPKRDIKNVSLSPLGIVHLFRQYFFELDTFLGTPTGHVWLSPGSTVELIEVSTRRVYTEKTVEQSTETTRKTESSSTVHDEISDAVKQDNKSDLKLGASLTVNQSWGTGNATATASLNMDTTQDTARESTHKRMREQTEKLSSEIKQNYKSTFKTITETTDTSSKRYVLNNTTPELINYELRRKMRQVGVQVQDIGTYLCWESFVDEPGRDLGLANLVNIAKPADLVAVPDTSDVPLPPDKPVAFTTNLTWNYDDDRKYNDPVGFLVMEPGVPMPPAPDGYEVRSPDGYVDVFQVSGTGEDFSGAWAFKGKLNGVTSIAVGPWIGSGGLEWDETINFVVSGAVWFTPDAGKRKEIADANAAKSKAGNDAKIENQRKTQEAYVNAAKLRIEQAGGVTIRKYEDLREEERIIVYRRLIGTLMSDALYRMPESATNDQMRHTLSELLNSIFDIDKMLYFVAPEWWKPRVHTHQYLGDKQELLAGNFTNWSDHLPRQDNYYITEKSLPARMGSSLGWLLQLDGDDLRNAFLNAPWVKAVIPVRPGKELEASNWLQQMHIEGTDGLNDLYQAPEEELALIRAALGVADVTLADALKYLCAQVALKHRESLAVGKYPRDEINDDNKVSATPIDKVYEHGFYPLKGGFRAVTSEHYEVFDQWIEVLPTDQVVPVPVTYNPRTGRQVLP